MKNALKKVISIFMVILTIISLLPVFVSVASAEEIWDGSVASSFASGSGTEDDPYIIETAAQLAYFASGGTLKYLDAHVKLANNICLNDTSNWENWATDEPENEWVPIAGNEGYSFKGVFDGNNKVISGVYVNKTGDNGYSAAGLFGYAGGATFKNIVIKESYFHSYYRAGSIAAYCTSSGVNNSTNIINCISYATVSGKAAGGIVGVFDNGTITGCTNLGRIIGNDNDSNAGGITGNVMGGTFYTASINKCFNGGTITGARAGGISGRTYSYGSALLINNCYNFGNINSTQSSGGLIGLHDYYEYRKAICLSSCYNIGKIEGEKYCGQIIGSISSSDSSKEPSGTFCSLSYYCCNASGTNQYAVGNYLYSGGCTSLTKEKAQLQASYLNLDFETVWTMSTDKSYPYPVLVDNPHKDMNTHFHSYASTVIAQPTCTKNGAKAYLCECNDYYTRVIPSLGHDIIIDKEVKATCTKIGLAEGQHCSRCNDVTIEQEITSELGHDIIIINEAVDATCTETGLTAAQYCTRCADATQEQKPTPVLGHDYDYTKSESNLTRPTETTDGYYTFACKNGCNITETESVKRADYSAYDKQISKLEGYLINESLTDKAKQEISDSINTLIQNNEYYDGNGNLRTDLIETEQAVVDSAASEIGVIVINIENKIASNEYVKANYSEIDEKIAEIEKKLESATISEDLTNELESIKAELNKLKENADASQTDIDEALESLVTRLESILSVVNNCESGVHSFTNYVVVEEAKCISEGKKAAKCNNGCGAVDEAAIPALNHKDTLVKVEAQAPTCAEIGWDAYEYCTACTYTTYEEKGTVEHDIVIDKAVKPTCTETGLTEGQHCSRCDGMTVVQETVPALNHKSTLVKVESQAPTCTEIGWDAYEYCTACTYTTYVEKGALKHDIVIDKAVAPTCTETGLTEGQHCSRCDDMIVKQEVVPVKPHNHTAKHDSAKHWEECVCGSEINVQNHSFVGGNICSCGFKRTVNSAIKIKNNNGSKTINYGETLKLTATVTNRPANAKIYWCVDGEKKFEGEVFNVNFENGTKIITVKLVDENGVVYQNANGDEITDSENVTVKGGFFQKIISFFKNLFGINRTVVQTIFKGIY